MAHARIVKIQIIENLVNALVESRINVKHDAALFAVERAKHFARADSERAESPFVFEIATVENNV